MIACLNRCLKCAKKVEQNQNAPLPAVPQAESRGPPVTKFAKRSSEGVLRTFGRSLREQEAGRQKNTQNWQASNAPRHYSYTDNNLSPGRYAYRIKQTDRTGKFTYAPEATVEVGMAPREFWLSQNYPNPFNPSTEVKFSVATTGRATVGVYNTVGQRLAVLFNEVAQEGQYYRATLNGANLASGLYFARLQSGNSVATRKMILLK